MDTVRTCELCSARLSSFGLTCIAGTATTGEGRMDLSLGRRCSTCESRTSSSTPCQYLAYLALRLRLPDRIGKGMIEAVANPAVWTEWHSHQWMDNFIQDADEAYHWFLNSCAKVRSPSP